MQKSILFVKKRLKINILRIRNIFRDNCPYTCEYRGSTNRICNLKYSIPQKITITFHNWSNYDYNFIIKESAEESEDQFICLGENTKKYITISVPIGKEVKRIGKNEEKVKKAYYNLLIVQDLWQAHYQILLIILLKKFIELNVNMDMMIKKKKKCETCGIKCKDC